MWETIEAITTPMPQNGGDTGPEVITQRMKVFGGWIVRVMMYSTGGADACAVSTTFVDDSAHQWMSVK